MLHRDERNHRMTKLIGNSRERGHGGGNSVKLVLVCVQPRLLVVDVSSLWISSVARYRRKFPGIETVSLITHDLPPIVLGNGAYVCQEVC